MNNYLMLFYLLAIILVALIMACCMIFLLNCFYSLQLKKLNLYKARHLKEGD